jgi:stearoyl-CoA desaturase (delta-9 desaturase)
VWQHKHQLVLMALMGYILPAAVAGLFWNDWKGGFVYAGILRLFAAHQATFSVNSMLHWVGERPFDDRHSPRDFFPINLIVLGDGYHNFHHTFPVDYRCGLEWYHYDPTKWFIRLGSLVGLTGSLKTFRFSEIEKRRVQQSQKDLSKHAAGLDWGVPLETLPVVSWDEYVRDSKAQSLVAIGGVVYDVGSFTHEHPGGRALLLSAIGKDASAMFNGGIYAHSLTACNILATLRVAIIHGGGEMAEL